MSHLSSWVHLVVAKDFGDQLRSLAVGEAVWVADTAANRPVVESIWSERLAGSVSGCFHGITLFQIAPDRMPEDWLIGILDQVELHHGEHSQSPPYSAARVLGAPLSLRLRAEFAERGFLRFEGSEDGFVAYKSIGHPCCQPDDDAPSLSPGHRALSPPA